MSNNLYSPKKVAELTTFSRAQIHRLVKAGEFPKPIPLSESRTAFIADEIEAWIDGKVRAARGDRTAQTASVAA